MSKNSHFQRGSGAFTCVACGRLTRHTGQQAHGSDVQQLAARLDQLGFSAHEREIIAQAACQAPALAARLQATRAGAEIGAAIDGARVETVALAATWGGEAQALSWLSDLRHRALAIGGDDLIAHGIPEGPALGAGLGAARAALLDGVADSRQTQLELALRVARAAVG
jgi:tRNA nucleotidyltransferase (CCA-adding enzyme)